jgi:hypothetical protein
MYKDEVPMIAERAKQSSEVCVDIVALVSLSIQYPWFSMPTSWEQYQRDGVAARVVWGMKRETLLWAAEHKELLHGLALRDDAFTTVYEVSKAPGLGLVKAGFVAQLFGQDAGCIDLHNAQLYAVSRSALSLSTKVSDKARARKVSEYLDLCQRLGGAAHLWDAWCEHLARVDARFKSAEDVSKMHLLCLK